APVKLSADDAVKKPAPVKLSADDALKNPDPVKPSSDDVVKEPTPVKPTTEDTIDDSKDDDVDSLVGDDLGGILNDIIEETVLPDTPTVENKAGPEVETSKAKPALEKSPDDMTLEEMLESAEETLLADDLEESESESEEIASEAEKIEEELERLSSEDEVNDSVTDKPPAPQAEKTLIVESTKVEPAPAEAAPIEEKVSEPVSHETAPDEVPPQETVKAAEGPSSPAEEMSIEDLLNSAEELLKDNYLEKTQAVAAESETLESTAAPARNQVASEIPLDPKPMEIQKPPTMAEIKGGAGEESLADIDSSSLESEDELDTVFNAIQDFDGTPVITQESQETQGPEKTPGDSQIYVEPESEDLLNQMAPSAFTEGGSEGKPDLIQETLSYLSDLSPTAEKEEPSPTGRTRTEQRGRTSMNKGTTADMFSEVVGEHIQRILERSLQDAIAKEISGLSRTIERSVQEIVKEVTPGIARTIIQEEIEKIRKMEEF
ncbi:MAG: hypothetical protein VYC17_00780, partial [Nitrospinota bacterium]|nr:hypothetical protein [Nitrospinota bacterium]